MEQRKALVSAQEVSSQPQYGKIFTQFSGSIRPGSPVSQLVNAPSSEPSIHAETALLVFSRSPIHADSASAAPSRRAAPRFSPSEAICARRAPCATHVACAWSQSAAQSVAAEKSQKHSPFVSCHPLGQLSAALVPLAARAPAPAKPAKRALCIRTGIAWEYLQGVPDSPDDCCRGTWASVTIDHFRHLALQNCTGVVIVGRASTNR
jgi:hypothetical protein